MKTKLTAERLRELLRYDPETGIFTAAVARANLNAGDIAGCPNAGGYIHIRIDYARYGAHRLAWLWMTGAWPNEKIDHINGDKADNRWCNLREATSAQNCWNRQKASNNTSGFKGVHWHKAHGRWVARIMIDGKRRHLGAFDTPEEAYAAYCNAARRDHCEFANFGGPTGSTTGPA